MSQLSYVNQAINQGYDEIDPKDCPVIWKKKNIVYFKKGERYAMVDESGHFFNWKHPEETADVISRTQYRPL